MKRRSFIRKASAAAGTFYIVPSFVLGGNNHTAPSDTLYMATIGVGGRGNGVLRELYKTNKVKFVAFCDVDDRRAKQTYEQFEKVPRYKDFRKVYENHLSEIDAFSVATPDHTHAAIALPFMQAGKHAYVEKPLTHNISEARMMTRVARERGIITQMGNQGSSTDGIRTAREWMESGVIGKVHKVDCWTNRPVWPQGMGKVPQPEAVPEGLNWDLWLGPAAYRPYSPAYLPFKWRGWWDFGTGALGDMGCHIMETPFNALDLKYPYEAEASCTTVWEGDFVEADFDQSPPPSSVVRLKFKSDKHGDVALNWYDGGLMPSRPEHMADDETMGDSGGGSIFYGDRGVMVVDTYSENPRILKYYEDKIAPRPKPYLKRVKKDHYHNFVNACMGKEEASSPFSYAGPLTEAVLMGNLAVRAYQYKELKEGKGPNDWDPYHYPGRKVLKWNGEAMNITNYDKANQWVNGSYRDGWKVTL
ncbi:Gfo/Idh/MocA family protein [Robertkochia aurantiaca]|uniref:Gfo/Idh/MocA family protein n=1 Tax=Robertkochia aurantiaca TaxID=2873700 RepID=UPI001CCF0BC7|nr:Gfo/Idh/MocA family oxidoreductase [Robertkochia sp. 3YJGBD-33]